jgi:hypothetical protein
VGLRSNITLPIFPREQCSSSERAKRGQPSPSGGVVDGRLRSGSGWGSDGSNRNRPASTRQRG